MRRVMLQWIVVIFALAGITATAFAANEIAVKGEDVSISGQLTCTSCILANPNVPCEKGCSEKCIKAGDPPLLTDSEGNQYILLSRVRGKRLMTAKRYKMVGGTVTVKGTLIKGKGIQAIYVETMEKM